VTSHTRPVDDADLAAMLLIRHFELRVLELFAAGQVGGTTHTCLGQEYVPVALNPLLRADDVVFSNHRGHGHYLARHDDPAGLLAEIMGREGALCGGLGGSQHLYRPGFMATGVQGESLAVAVGVGLDLLRVGGGGIAVVYVGDGTWGEGAVYEGLNMARLWDVPLLVVVENNGIAQSTPTERHMAGTIGGRAAAFDVPHLLIRSRDPAEIRTLTGAAVARVRRSPSPLVLEFVTDRLGPHSKGDDTRSAEVVERLRERDWCQRYAAAYPEQFAVVDRAQSDRVGAVVADVSARPLAGRWDR
jgi:TPP-dependent pyruvate/acetoin dehydrogenase alpha subunit